MNCILKIVCCLAMFIPGGALLGFGSCYDNSCINEGVDASIDLTGGYRYDKLTASVHVFDPPDNLVLTDNLKINGLNIYEIGVDGRILVCRQWFVRIFGTFGRENNQGRYAETVTALGIGEATTYSKVRNANTSDFSIGGGYLFPCGCGVGVGPSVGWSYDYSRIKMGNAFTGGTADPVLDRLSYKTRWQGPWVGVEAQYNCYNSWVALGYQYHWSHWHASWRLSGPDIPDVAFSDRRKCNGAFGNVIFLDGAYGFCDTWEIALCLKAQYWKANDGKIKPRSRSIVFGPGEVNKLHSATWHSYEALAMIGYHF